MKFGILKSKIENVLLESYAKDTFKSEIKNFKQVGNSITFDYNEYCWVQQEYIPAFLKTFKFSANNSFMPIVYFYNPLDDTTYLVKYETID
jgi:hypothetical protein